MRDEEDLFSHVEFEKCKWRTDSCHGCTAENPFSTDSYCTIAIALYYASGNILCPKCYDGYLHLTKTKQYHCELCDFSTDYEVVLSHLILDTQ